MTLIFRALCRCKGHKHKCAMNVTITAKGYNVLQQTSIESRKYFLIAKQIDSTTLPKILSR